MKLVFTHRFRDELKREYLFIRGGNPQAARNVRRRIVDAVTRLKDYPQMGRAWRLKGTMELVIPGLPYVVIYEPKGDTVHILVLFHTSRKFPPEMKH